MKFVKLWMMLVENTALQKAMHTNVCEPGWCKCGICVGWKIIEVSESYKLNLKLICHNRDVALAGPIMDAVPYHAGTLPWKQEATPMALGATSITTVNFHKKNPWRRDWRRGLVRNKNISGLDNNICASVCNLMPVKAIISETSQLTDYWASRELHY